MKRGSLKLVDAGLGSAPRLTCSLAFILCLLHLTGCRRDMFAQPRYKPLGQSDLFADGAASRPPVPNTVARGHLTEDEVLFTGKFGGKLVEVMPFPVTRDLLGRGRVRFEIHCAGCHGYAGDGDGMVVQRGYPAPPSYHIDRLRTAPIGYYFDVVTNGYGVMYSYAAHVEPRERWAIAAYLRAL